MNKQTVNITYDDYVSLLGNNIRVYATQNKANLARYELELRKWQAEEDAKPWYKKLFRPKSYYRNVHEQYDRFLKKYQKAYDEEFAKYQSLLETKTNRFLTTTILIKDYYELRDNTYYTHNANVNLFLAMWLHGIFF